MVTLEAQLQLRVKLFLGDVLNEGIKDYLDSTDCGKVQNRSMCPSLENLRAKNVQKNASNC